jgi:hypothetical protein
MLADAKAKGQEILESEEHLAVRFCHGHIDEATLGVTVEQIGRLRALSPRLRAPLRVKHHAQDAVDAEPGMPEASVGVVHFVFGSPQDDMESRFA